MSERDLILRELAIAELQSLELARRNDSSVGRASGSRERGDSESGKGDREDVPKAQMGKAEEIGEEALRVAPRILVETFGDRLRSQAAEDKRFCVGVFLALGSLLSICVVCALIASFSTADFKLVHAAVSCMNAGAAVISAYVLKPLNLVSRMDLSRRASTRFDAGFAGYNLLIANCQGDPACESAEARAFVKKYLNS